MYPARTAQGTAGRPTTCWILADMDFERLSIVCDARSEVMRPAVSFLGEWIPAKIQIGNVR